jgi:hypothetical protein
LPALPTTPNSSADDTALAQYHRVNYDLFNQCEGVRADARQEYLQAQAALDAAALDSGANRLALPPIPESLTAVLTRPTFIPEPDDTQFAQSVREYRSGARQCYALVQNARTEIALLQAANR